MATGPRASAAASIVDPTCVASVTSAMPKAAASPESTACRSGFSSRPTTVTTAPAPVSAAAIARPMPRPPPVTKACLPASAIACLEPGRESARRRHLLSLKFLDFKLVGEIFQA
jgi:hypothetical protein